MKKILFIFILVFLNTHTVLANELAQQEEEVRLKFDNTFSKQVINDAKHIDENKIVLNEKLPEIPPIQPQQILEDSNSLSTHSRFYNGLSQTAHNLYNLQIEQTNSPSSLFKEPLTKHFESGPLESLHTWAVVQTNFDTTIPDGDDTDTKFNVGLINVLFDGQFRGGKENFRLMLDPTHNHNHPFLQQFVQDAYIESHRIPHHTILVGNSRPGVGYEGAQSPYTLPFVNRSQISRNLANVRKVGLRVKGDYSLVDYDFGGYSSDTFFSEFMPGVEFDGWINLKPLGKTDGRYGKLVTGGGIVSGVRNSIDYFVGGAYIGYEYKKFWTRMEYATSDGSNGGSGLTTKRRQGWYVTLGYHITKKLEILARYDEFDPDKTISDNNQREYTAGINYYIKGQALKLILNYIYCQNDCKPDSHRILVGAQLAL